MLTDIEIKSLIEDVKPIFSKEINDIRPQLKSKRQHKEHEIDILSLTGNMFKIKVRVNNINVLDFSVILMYQDDNKKWYILRRYNGNSHRHTNKIEKEILRSFHIHKATERYQRAGYKIEYYAEGTDLYSNWHDALNLMLKDCNFKKNESDLFGFDG